MDNKIINEIIKLEDNIANIYYNLYMLELSNSKEGCIYSHYINSLKDALMKEDKLFKSLSANELLSFSLYIKDNANKKCNNLSSYEFNIFITERICERIKYFTFKLPIADKRMKEIKKRDDVLSVVFDEQNDIYLSFLDEYINNEKDSEIKKELMFTKYDLIFMSGVEYEKQKVNKEFTIDKSLYIDTDIKASIKKINLSEIYSAKREISASEIYKCIEEFVSKNSLNKNIVNYTDNIIFLVKIRTCCLLMDEETFKGFLSSFTVTSAISNLINNTFNIDILDILNKDRERHKYLSLKRK